MRRAAERGLSVTGHLLLGLPLETHESLIEGAQALAALPLDALKFHRHDKVSEGFAGPAAYRETSRAARPSGVRLAAQRALP